MLDNNRNDNIDEKDIKKRLMKYPANKLKIKEILNQHNRELPRPTMHEECVNTYLEGQRNII